MVMNKSNKMSINKDNKKSIKPNKTNLKNVKVHKKIVIKKQNCEEKIQETLLTPDNGDIEKVEQKEVKINRKRKFSSSEDDEQLKKSKKISGEESAEEDSENEESDEEESEVEEKEIATVLKNEPKRFEVVKAGEEVKVKSAKNEMKKKADKENAVKKQLLVKEMFEDTPTVESASLKKEIHDRLISRMKNTIVFNSLPHKFNLTDAKKLVPDLVSCVIPYNSYLHKISGTAYIDLATPQEATSIAKKLNQSEYKSRNIFVMIQTKIIDDVDKYNCQRLVVSNVHPKGTLEDIKRILPKALQVEILPQRNVDRKEYRTAFAHYSSVEDAIIDYDTKHGVEIHECPINLKFQIRKSENVKERSTFDMKRLTVFGLKKNTSLEELKKTFPQAIEIKPAFDKGVATIVYKDEEECKIDRSKAIESINGKWRINLAIQHENKFEDKKFEGKKFEGKKFEGKKFEGKKFEGKKFEGKKFEGKKFEGKKFEGKKFEGKKFEGKKFEGKKFEGKKFEGKKFEGKKFEGKKFEGKKFEGKKFEGKKINKEDIGNISSATPQINKSISTPDIDRTARRKLKKAQRKLIRQKNVRGKVNKI